MTFCRFLFGWRGRRNSSPSRSAAVVSPQEVSDPYVTSLRPVPPSGPGVCSVCHSAASAGTDLCSSCRDNQTSLTHGATPVVPISLTLTMGQLYYVLRKYKDSANQDLRERFTLVMGALLVRFLQAHRACLERLLGGPWTLVTSVPSSSGRPPPHPLDRAIGKSRSLRSLMAPVLQRGPHDLDHNIASDRGYVLRDDADVHDQRILLLDDTFTSGARAQSAASRLLIEGAGSVVIVCVGRVIRPDWSQETEDLWGTATARGFVFEECCLCAAGPWTIPPH